MDQQQQLQQMLPQSQFPVTPFPEEQKTVGTVKNQSTLNGNNTLNLPSPEINQRQLNKDGFQSQQIRFSRSYTRKDGSSTSTNIYLQGVHQPPLLSPRIEGQQFDESQNVPRQSSFTVKMRSPQTTQRSAIQQYLNKQNDQQDIESQDRSNQDTLTKIMRGKTERASYLGAIIPSTFRVSPNRQTFHRKNPTKIYQTSKKVNVKLDISPLEQLTQGGLTNRRVTPNRNFNLESTREVANHHFFHQASGISNYNLRQKSFGSTSDPLGNNHISNENQDVLDLIYTHGAHGMQNHEAVVESAPVNNALNVSGNADQNKKFIDGLTLEQHNRNVRFYKSFLKDSKKVNYIQNSRGKQLVFLNKQPKQPRPSQELKQFMTNRRKSMARARMREANRKKPKLKRGNQLIEKATSENLANNFVQEVNDEVQQSEISLDDELQDFGAIVNTKCLLTPESVYRNVIDFLSFVLIIMISLYVPFVFAFDIDTSGPFEYFEFVLDVWFILEIILNFFTAYLDKGLLVTDRKMIALSYLKGWFVVDLFSSIPISFIEIILQEDPSITSEEITQTAATGDSGFSTLQSTKLLRVFRMAKYARLLRLIRFLKVNQLLSGIEEVIVSEQANLLMRFSKLSIMVFFFAHWIACALYSVAQQDLEMYGRNWLSLQNLNTASIVEQYVNSLYWAFTTMCTVGYGDHHPSTTNERMISMVCMIISSGTFAFIIGDIGRMVSSFNLLAAQFREKMIYVEQFLIQKQIPLNIRQQVKRFLEYNWNLKKIYKIEEKEVLDLLNENLKGKITVYLNGQILQNIEILANFPIEFLSNLSFILRKATYAIDDNLIVEKEQGDQMFFMVAGRVAVIHKSTRTHLKDLDKDQYFGEISFFTELPRQATIKAREFSELLILERDDFLSMAAKVSVDTLGLYHRIRESVISSDIQKRNYKQLQIKCYVCDTIGHIAVDCQNFDKIKGNLKKLFKKLYNQTLQSYNSQSSQINDEQLELKRKNNLIVNTQATTRRNSIDKTHRLEQQLQQQKEIDKARQQSMSLREEMASNSQKHDVNSFSNIVVLTKKSNKRVSQIAADDPFNLLVGQDDAYQHSDNALMSPRKQGTMSKRGSQIQQEWEQRQARSNKQSREVLPQARLVEEIKEVDEDDSIYFKYSAAHVSRKQGNTSCSVSSANNSNRAFVPGEQSSSSSGDGDDKPLLKQCISKSILKPPNNQNELTKLVGKNKRFASKNHREQQQQQPQIQRRIIQIMPFKDIQKRVKKTVIQKTFTTLVETYTHEEEEYFENHRTPRKAYVRKEHKNHNHASTQDIPKTRNKSRNQSNAPVNMNGQRSKYPKHRHQSQLNNKNLKNSLSKDSFYLMIINESHNQQQQQFIESSDTEVVPDFESRHNSRLHILPMSALSIIDVGDKQGVKSIIKTNTEEDNEEIGLSFLGGGTPNTGKIGKSKKSQGLKDIYVTDDEESKRSWGSHRTRKHDQKRNEKDTMSLVNDSGPGLNFKQIIEDWQKNENNRKETHEFDETTDQLIVKHEGRPRQRKNSTFKNRNKLMKELQKQIQSPSDRKRSEESKHSDKNQ